MKFLYLALGVTVVLTLLAFIPCRDRRFAICSSAGLLLVSLAVLNLWMGDVRSHVRVAIEEGKSREFVAGMLERDQKLAYGRWLLDAACFGFFLTSLAGGSKRDNSRNRAAGNASSQKDPDDDKQ
jgi:hypothetical protein